MDEAACEEERRGRRSARVFHAVLSLAVDELMLRGEGGDLGRGAAHAKKKMLSSTKVPGGKADACFVVKGLAENDVLCGECNSRADAVALKDALNALLRCAARWPNRLASG